MNEIKCPNCGEEFSIDENYYNKIVKQIRDKEFAKEVKNIEAKCDKDMEHLLQLSRLELQKGFDEELADKDAEIVKLKAKIETNEVAMLCTKMGQGGLITMLKIILRESSFRVTFLLF